jgi:hypothetical protein
MRGYFLVNIYNVLVRYLPLAWVLSAGPGSRRLNALARHGHNSSKQREDKKTQNRTDNEQNPKRHTDFRTVGRDYSYA